MASAEDVIFMAIILFSFVLAAFFTYYAYDTFLDHAHNQTVLTNVTEAMDVFDNTQTKVADKFDYVVFALLIGFVLAIIIGSLFVLVHPIFTIIYFIILIIAMVLSSVLAYIWNQISTMSQFATTLTAFPLSNFMLNNYPIFILAAGFIGMIIMYAKGQNA
jgi:hypothetical protein